MKQRTVARWQTKWLMIFLSFGLAASAQAAQWPTHEFVIVNAAPGTPIQYPVASNTGFSGEIADHVMLMESYLGKVSLHFQNLGFAAPQLERVDGRKEGEAYLVRLHDYSNEETHARYATNAGYLEVDLSRAFENKEVSDETLEALAHELFHAVQRSYLESAQLEHGNWIIEGQAQAVGMDTALMLEGVDVYKGKNDDYRLGGRQYFRPLPTETIDETYRTASFWRYLAELDAPSVEPDYRYLADVFSIPFEGPTSEDADLQWLDMGLRKATGEGLAHHYSHFAATIANYIPSRLTGEPSGTPEQASDKWLDRLFGPCPVLALSESVASATTTTALRKNAARCFKVNVEKSEKGAPRRAATGADFLRRMRGQKADTDVDLAVQARAANRADLEALWLGKMGDGDAAAAYIGRDSDSYVGYWHFSIPAGKPQTFIISNVAEDATRTLNQDLPLTLFTSAAHMSSASSGLGDLVGGPIDLRFDSFPLRDILSADSEEQKKAGIARPCMLRLQMRDSESNAEFALLMDNDGPIQAGIYQAEDARSQVEVPGRFTAAVSFGQGSNRVSYRAEAGSMELKAFTPNFLKGTVSVLGRLPDRVYGQDDSPWPETISVQTEFTLVPRVNLNSTLFKRNYCFE